MSNIQKPDHFLRTVTLMLLLIFGGFMVSDMYLPAIPHLMKAFSATSKQVQLTIAVYFTGACISMLILGPVSDRVGRRKVVLFGIVMMIIGTFCCWYAAHYNLFLIGRIFQGLGAGAGFAVMRTAMRDMVSGNDLAQVVSLISIIIGLCPAIAPAVGGMMMSHFSWQSIFLVTFIYYIVLFIAMIFMFPETLAKATQLKNRDTNVAKHAWHALTHSEFMLYCVTSASVYAGMMAYVTASPIIFEVHLHFTPAQFGWITLGIVISGQISKIYNRLYVSVKGYRYMMWVGIVLLAIGSLLMFVFALCHMMNIYALIIPMLFYANGMGILFPNLSTASLTVFTTIVGMASALYGTLQLGGGIVGSALIAHFSESTLLPLSSLLVIFVALATISLAYASRLEKRNQQINQQTSQLDNER